MGLWDRWFGKGKSSTSSAAAPVVESTAFAKEWSKALVALSGGSILGQMKLRSTEVRCSKCKGGSYGRDAARGLDLYCPSCGTAWFTK